MRLWTLISGTLLATIFASGCSQRPETLIADPDFESLGDNEGVPDGWALEVKSGEYRCAGASKAAYFGKSSLAFAGSGGEAELRSNSFQIKPGQAIDLQLWTRATFADKAFGRISIVISPGSPSEKLINLAPVVAGDSEWNHVRLIYAAQNQLGEVSAALAINLNGEALVRLDNIRTELMPVETGLVIPDGSFESPRQDGTFLKWTLNGDAPERKAIASQSSAFDGKSCLALSSNGTWCVSTSEISVPLKGRRIICQAAVRAIKGKANLKFEYSKAGAYVGGSFSKDVTTSEWTVLSVEPDPDLVAKSDSVGISLSIAGDGKGVSAEFDQLQVLVFE